MKKNQFLIVLIILCCFIGLPAQTKNKKFNKKKIRLSKIQKKKVSNTLIISGGVMNTKAINLVKPEYPLAAKKLKVRGVVKVSILIDEKGSVIKSEAYSGHPLLKGNSVSAALQSTFTPTTIGGNPVKVRGIIIYKYVLDIFNWLEIGYGVNGERFLEMLPGGFEEEKQLYVQYQSADYDEISIFQSLRASIENKLSNNPKNLWLFQVGILLDEIKSNCCAQDNLKEPISNLKGLLLDVPKNISTALIKKLNNLVRLSENPQLNTYDPGLGNKFYQQLEDIDEKLPMLGD
jgi:hypothetical protein